MKRKDFDDGKRLSQFLVVALALFIKAFIILLFVIVDVPSIFDESFFHFIIFSRKIGIFICFVVQS